MTLQNAMTLQIMIIYSQTLGFSSDCFSIFDGLSRGNTKILWYRESHINAKSLSFFKMKKLK